MKWLRAIRRRLVPPLDWTHGAGRPRVAPPASVDVIVPIHGAAEALAACLGSVAAGTDLTRHRVVLVVDGPQDDDVESVVREFAHGDAVRVLRNECRLGFAGSVNRGMSASTADVVLLNSDTIVTARWLEKLIDAAYARGDHGTVTPLSNHATICSVPRALEENLLPAGVDAESFARLVERVSARSYPLLPTGVGFCLYIRRALLDDIGLFDAARFPLGYGEENDFCVRALGRGWLHAADDATFIFHAGARSFGPARARLQRRARRRLHPRYRSTIAEFMRRDPLADVRARIASALSPSNAKKRLRVVHLVHGWPPFQQAGTELYAYWLVQRQRATLEPSVYTRGADPARGDGEVVELTDGGVRVRIATNHFTARNPLRRNAIRGRALERDFERFLKSEAPDLLHIHHLAGHTFSLAGVARRLGIPIVLQIQDWWFLCARVNYYDRAGRRCSGPAPSKCAACATLTKVPPAAMTNRFLHAARRRAARTALAAADAYIAGSQVIREDYADVIAAGVPFHVIPYGVAVDPHNVGWAAGPPGRGLPARPGDGRPSRPRYGGPAARATRFGYVGSIAPHKGVHVAIEAMRGIDPAAATLHVWGDADAYPEYVAGMNAGPGVVFEGRFHEKDKPRVYAAMDVLLVPSIGLESFGLAAREAMTCGVPVIATAGGALDEMFEPGLCGAFFPAGDAAALRAILRRVIDEPAIIGHWAANLPQPKRDDEHAAEIARVYESVLAAR